MEAQEIREVTIAIIILAALISIPSILQNNYKTITFSIIFSFIIILINIFAKKITAHYYETDIEHKTWSFSRYWLYPHHKFDFKIPAGVIFPLFFSFISLGAFKIMALLTYEARALKIRAAKRHGPYSFTELTDWHNALIGASGISALLVLAIITYVAGFESLSKFAIYYAFWNMLPIANFDGTQIFFGSRTTYAILAAITLIFTAGALLIV